MKLFCKYIVATYIHVPLPPPPPDLRAQRAHTPYGTRVNRNKPRIYIAELYTIWITQFVERSYVKRETRGSTPCSDLYFSVITCTICEMK